MKKRYFVFSLFFMFFLALSLVSAEVNVRNLTFNEKYALGETISGKLSINITQESIDSKLSSNWGQEILLKDFLDKNHARYRCDSINCNSSYSATNPTKTKLVPIQIGNESYFGFQISGDRILISDLSFSLSSDFQEQSTIPLTLKFFNKNIWQFQEVSTTYLNKENYGCYNPLTPETGSFQLKTGSDIYCEKINITDTPSIQIGAKITGTDNKQLRAFVVDKNKVEFNGASCLLTPSETCSATPSQGFKKDTYYVCISSNNQDTAYSILSQDSGASCGFYANSVSNLPSNSERDYAIFVKFGKYAAAKNITINKNKISTLVSDANAYLKQQYNQNCSSGCVLPILAQGTNQQLVLSNLSIDYTSSAGSTESTNFYSINTLSPRLSFSGLVDLAYTGFNISSSTINSFSLLFNGNNLFFQPLPIQVVSQTQIISISPSNPPAGANINFYAEIDSTKKILKYLWNFGDNSGTTETKNNSLKHTYSSIGNYNLNLTIVDASNFTTSKIFTINTTSPRDLINSSIDSIKNGLQNTIKTLNSFPSWYRKILQDKINVSKIQDTLTQVDKSRSLASSDQDFINLFSQLNTINAPYAVKVFMNERSPLISDITKINPEPVSIYAGGNLDNSSIDNYKNAIALWENSNLISNINKQEIYMYNIYGQKEYLMTYYNISLTPNFDSETYFVINHPSDEIYFNKISPAKKAGGYSVITLEKNTKNNFEFYLLDKEEPEMFVSPKLSFLDVAPIKVEACNYDNVCESELGENYKNCRNDCKPIALTIFYIFLLILGALIVYTLMQIWYKTRYEKFLFSDRRFLYNLVMFITNARVRGISNDGIEEMLKKQKWSGEQINYALKKSRGEKAGMYEIIPIERLFAYFRENSAKQNINKPQIQGVNRW